MSATLLQHPVGRVPRFETAPQWAAAMFDAGLDYHLDDADDIVSTETGEPTFTRIEAAALERLVATLSFEQCETCFEIWSAKYMEGQP